MDGDHGLNQRREDALEQRLTGISWQVSRFVNKYLKTTWFLRTKLYPLINKIFAGFGRYRGFSNMIYLFRRSLLRRKGHLLIGLMQLFHGDIPFECFGWLLIAWKLLRLIQMFFLNSLVFRIWWMKFQGMILNHWIFNIWWVCLLLVYNTLVIWLRCTLEWGLSCFNYNSYNNQIHPL